MSPFRNPSRSESLSTALDALKSGHLIMILDDSAPVHHGSLVGAASLATEDMVASMLNVGSGTLIAAVSEARTRELGLNSMCESQSPSAPEFLTSVEARLGVHSGISAADRAQTLKTLAITSSPTLDLVTPGHIFPLRVKEGGTLVRHAVPEGAVDLLRIADLPLTAAICLCMSLSGEAAEGSDLQNIIDTFHVPTLRLSEIVRHRLVTEQLVAEFAVTSLPTSLAGDFSARCFRSILDDSDHLVLMKGIPAPDTPVLVRMHSAQPFTDLFGEMRGGAAITGSSVIRGALNALERESTGVFVYLQHKREGRLSEELNALKSGTSTKPSVQLREIGIGAQILRQLGIRKIRLLSNSARAVAGLEGFGLEIVEQVNFAAQPTGIARHE